MGIVEWYQDIMQNKIDPRTSDWFMVTGPGPLLMIVMTYVYFSTSAGPRYMRDKKPYTLRNTLIIYNFIQVLLSIILVYESIKAGWFNGYSFKCEPVDRSMDPKSLRINGVPAGVVAVYFGMAVFEDMARAVWLYYICKLVELLDTVFFVLRKKQRQISFLHVYHHSLMPITAWIGVRFFPGGQVTLLGFINSFIHILMYMYYMLAAMGPEIQKYLWWKKYLTSLQLVQFSIIFVQNFQLFFIDCYFPKVLAGLLTINASLFIYLFGSFYVKNYLNSRAASQVTKKNGVLVNANGTRSNGIKSD